MQVRRTLQSFLDGEMDPRRTEIVAAHLESCTRCQVETETLRRVIAEIRRLRPDLNLAAYTQLVTTLDELTKRPSP